MTLLELKKKVLGLIEELNAQSELLTDDPDISTKINEVINQVMFELARIKKLPKYVEISVSAGDIIEFETGKKLGKHKGFWFHTIGQRKGLGLGGGPWFVVKKDTERNLIFVSKGYDPAAQYVNNIDLLDVMTMNPAIQFNDGQRVRYKIRHQPGFNTGVLKLSESADKLSIISEEAISGVAAGQFGIIYHETEPVVLGSGVIE